MRKLSQRLTNNTNDIKESFTGVMNHYTPIDNIVINTRNIFGALLGLVVSKAEDGISLKIESNRFDNPETTQNILNNSTFDNRTFLGQYINRQGLPVCKIVDLGSRCIVYFSPDNIAPDPCTADTATACIAMKEANLTEAEMTTINEDMETELEDHTKEELAEILNDGNKVKAANDFADKIKNVVTLPENMYIKATKDSDGHESVSLRYKYTRRRPFGGKQEAVVSLMNIYSTGPNAIWVDAYLDKDRWDDDVLNVIDAILIYIGAEETGDDAVYNIPDGNSRPVTAEKPDEADIEKAQTELNDGDSDTDVNADSIR